jgi:N-formylglutamate amidohydrolase
MFWINGKYHHNLWTMRRYVVLLCAIVQTITHLNAQTYRAGNTYFSDNQYIEYRAGNLPIIITAPHGGRLLPTTIADRNCANCTTVMDGNTMELAYQIDTAIREVFGCFPHIVINRLHRIKLDANREIVEAANGSPIAESAWQWWHQYIQAAKNNVVQRYGSGMLIDLHGHGHTIQRLELGYLLSDAQLRLPDSVLATTTYRDQTSIKNLVLNNLNRYNTPQLLRGPFALGTLLSNNGFPSVPAQSDVAPAAGDFYFDGGYNTARHGSRDSTTIDAIQIECNATGVRDSYENRRTFARQLAAALRTYLNKHYFNNVNFACRTVINKTPSLPLGVYFDAPQKQLILTCASNYTPNHWITRLYNAQGQMLLEKKWASNPTLVLDAPFQTGVYILTISAANGELLHTGKCVIAD